MVADGKSPTLLSRRDIEMKMVAAAWQDEGFRKKLLSNPKALFEEKLGVKLPDELKITIHEEGENSLHFVIPVNPRGAAGELSNEDLDKVAGGIDTETTKRVIDTLAQGVVAGPQGMRLMAKSNWGF